MGLLSDIYSRKIFREKKNGKITNVFFLLLFNDLKFGKSSLFCCYGYRHAIFIILFYESQEEYLRKAFTKEKIVNDFFIAVPPLT